ncbi:hypothetical protein [Sulfitobacter sp. M13]
MKIHVFTGASANAFDIDPGTYVPRIMTMTGFNLWTFIGVHEKPRTQKIRQFQPEYMPRDTNGMGDLAKMEMPLPDNSIPMITGWGPYGPIEMGGMFSVVKVRDGIDADDYEDPGWYENQPGEQAYEWTGELPEFVSNNSPKTLLPPKPASKG